LLRSEPYEREAQTLQGPGFGGSGLDEDVVVADLEDIRAGGGDGGAGAGVRDLQNLVGRGVLGGLSGGGGRQAEPEGQHERQPQQGQATASSLVSQRGSPFDPYPRAFTRRPVTVSVAMGSPVSVP